MGILQTIIFPSFELCMPHLCIAYVRVHGSIRMALLVEMRYLGLKYDPEIRDGMQNLD